MHRVRLVILLLTVVEAGWMSFDGTRALIVGELITPKTGPYAAGSGRGASSRKPSASTRGARQ